MRVTGALVEIIAKNLGTDLEQIRDTFVSQALKMAYYPACPVAHDNVLGFSPHSDISTLTLVWELNMVEGLQIKRKGVWVPIEPQCKALVVNVGDFLEVCTIIDHEIVITKMQYSQCNEPLND
jgi:isopenicillin N synthase-like dioxygenase